MNIDCLQRSHRKTVALYVRPDGSLEVRAPLRLGITTIQAFVDSKTDWIARQRKKLSAMSTLTTRNGYANGSSLWFLGRILKLDFSSNVGNQFKLVDNHLLVPARHQINPAPGLMAWYRAEAQQIITVRVNHYANTCGLSFKSIRINSARTRWGSCGPAHNLNFPYRLIMAPLEIIDYVVVHELAHTSVHNHGKGFWAKVAAILPDYPQRRKWLRVNGHLLDLNLEPEPDRIVAVQSKVRRKAVPAVN